MLLDLSTKVMKQFLNYLITLSQFLLLFDISVCELLICSNVSSYL